MALPDDLQLQLEKAVAILKKDGVVAYPTDTVYGLGGASFSPIAVERIFKIKQRPRTMALPLLVATSDQIRQLVLELSPLAEKLIADFMPGALTLVLKRSPEIPDFVTAGADTVAVRIPAHPVPVALIHGLGEPLIGTSANLSGKPSILNATEVRAQLGNQVDFIVDGGPCGGGTESTIVDLSGIKPVIIREGAIPRTALEPYFD